MGELVLVTGGAGFVGSHVARELLRAGYEVRAFDALTPQVHGDVARPSYLDREVELVVGDLRDPEAVGGAVAGVDHVVHLAARVGVGQSMYEIDTYSGVNTYGTGVLLQALLAHRVGRLVVASSMSIYGEGLYRDPDGSLHESVERTRSDLQAGRWEPRGPDGEELEPRPTPESKRPSLSSMYALTKFDQEHMCLLFGSAYDVPTVALRFFNIYGPDQALSNPYTGVLAIFAARLLNSRRPLLFEDGRQRRDFVSVHDVARACRLALEKPAAQDMALNIGSGASVSVLEVAAELARVMDKGDLGVEIVGKYRTGDIRHCFADISRARAVLDYQPEVTLAEGMTELAEWLASQTATDRVDDAAAELSARGLAF